LVSAVVAGLAAGLAAGDGADVCAALFDVASAGELPATGLLGDAGGDDPGAVAAFG
jgi:hypothetical protein